jgi:excisionase family DNA binding protein
VKVFPSPHPPFPRPQPAPNVVPPEARQPGLLSVPEAADYLSISHRSLWAMTAPRGPIPSIKFGRAVRYPIEGLDAFIAENGSKPRRP